MEAIIEDKRETRFRFDPGLIEHLKKLAKRNHQSLNEYVENLLHSVTSYPSKEDLTQKICNGLEEVKLIREGKMRGYTLEEALNEI